MKDLSKIYLEAARMIAENEEDFSCCAISIITTGSVDGFSREVEFYAKIFSPTGWCNGFLTYIDIESQVDPDNLRVLMLCLMAVAWRDLK